MHRLARPTSWWGWAFAFARGAEKALTLKGGAKTAAYLADAALHAASRAERGEPLDGRLTPVLKLPATHQTLVAFGFGKALKAAEVKALQKAGLVQTGTGKGLTRKGRCLAAHLGVALPPQRGEAKPGPRTQEAEDADPPPPPRPSDLDLRLVERGQASDAVIARVSHWRAYLDGSAET
jgi:hypothetical protein